MKYIKRDEWDKYFYRGRKNPQQIQIKDETFEEESAKVDYCLKELKREGFFEGKDLTYDIESFQKFRDTIHRDFFIYWTAIHPPMEHLLYALSCIIQPQNILGFGIFTGNPVVWSMGPAMDQLYPAGTLEGIEINKKHAKICQDNFDKVVGKDRVKIYGDNGFDVIKTYADESINLLYMDANGRDPLSKEGFFGKRKNTKRINYSFLKLGYDKIAPGGFAMCHNAYDGGFRKKVHDWITFSDDTDYFEKAAIIGIDEEGLAINLKKS